MNQGDESRKLLERRFIELDERAAARHTTEFSDFLDLNGQNILLGLHLRAKLCGGYDRAERRVACFGNGDAPIVCVLISPANRRFAEELSHRDYLGSIMALGIKRETLGDIVLSDGSAFVFCLKTVSEFIINNLDRVRHTTVTCRICDPDSDLSGRCPEIQSIIAASDRADAVISSVFNISRSKSQELFAVGKVFSNGRCLASSATTVKPGEIISVRGFGRFIVEETFGETKKGRLRLGVRVFK